MPKFYKYTIVLILTLCALLCGCQPTPEKSAVVQKNNLNEQIMQTAAPSSSDETEDIWQETLEQNGVTVTIDAAVEIPDVTSWPVIEVKPYGFTEQDAQKAVDVFMQGQPIYETNYIRSKADIEQDIIWLNQQLENAKTDNTIDANFYKYQLRDYQALYDEAPEQTPERVKTDVKFKTDPDPDAEANQSIHIEADLGKSIPAWIAVTTSKDNLSGAISFSNLGSRHVSYYPMFEATETLAGLNV